MKIVRFDDHGRIYRASYIPDSQVEIQDPGYFVGDYERATHYLNNGDVQERSAQQLPVNKTTIDADGVDSAVVSSVPPHTIVVWPNGDAEEVNDGGIEFATDLPGAYEIAIDAVAHKPYVLTITAV